MTLTEFLMLRVAEDEASAGYLMPGTTPTMSGPYTVDHPVRLLAECAAKRAIVEGWSAFLDGAPEWAEREVPSVLAMARRTLAELAAVYADHADYDATWRP